MRKMLKDLGIRFEEQIGIKEPACQPDFFIQPNILIFTDGDRIHTNPNPHLIPSRSKKIYPGYKDDYKLFRNITAKDMWARDRRITKGLKKEGYKVLRFWHSELETEKEKCLQKILKAVK
jgi:G:T-mismatch repair DNA endonuclease (very short patch repair protein)